MFNKKIEENVIKKVSFSLEELIEDILKGIEDHIINSDSAIWYEVFIAIDGIIVQIIIGSTNVADFTNNVGM